MNVSKWSYVPFLLISHVFYVINRSKLSFRVILHYVFVSTMYVPVFKYFYFMIARDAVAGAKRRHSLYL